MADLVAIGYPDETTAALAMSEAEHLAEDLIIQPDAIAAIVRTKDGKFRVTTNHHEVAGGATWGMWWGFLFGLLFFVPFLGMAVGAGLGALTGKLGKSGGRQGVPGAGSRAAPARHLGALPRDREGHPGQGGRGAEQVRRHRPQVVAVEGDRGRAAGGPPRHRARSRLARIRRERARHDET